MGGDDPVAAEIGGATGATLVGAGPECTYRMVDLKLARSSISFAFSGQTVEISARSEFRYRADTMLRTRRSQQLLHSRPGSRSPQRREPFPDSRESPAASNFAANWAG